VRPPDEEPAAASAARRYSELGWAIVRCDGKKAKGEGWQKTLPGEPGSVAGMWSVWNGRFNLGIVLGTSGLVVVEYDKGATEEAFLELLGGALPETPIVRTGSGRLHVYFTDPGGLEKVSRDGFELRVGGHQCLAPPSIHPETGESYAWLPEHGPELPLLAVPERVLEFFSCVNGNKPHAPAPLAQVIPLGERHETLFKLMCADRRKGLAEEELLARARVVNETRGAPALPEDELRELARDVANRYRPDPAAEIPSEPAYGGPEVDGAQLLDEIVLYTRRFVVMSTHQLVAVALFVVHTHALDAADTTPYIAATSAEKRSGKTRLLEVLELVVRKPLPTANISDAALFRTVAEFRPTLLFDEVDAIFGAKARDREDLRGMLNAGYRRGASVYRMGGGNNTELQKFPVFCSKVFAGIGRLPDTVADRSIPIRLERRTSDEPIERFRRREVSASAEQLRERIEHWAAAHIDELSAARPPLPDELDDRAQDVWEPLLAIADSAGGDWPAKTRAAALALSTGDEREDDSLTARLLADICQVFEETDEERFKTADLILRLCAIEESPWGDFYGKTITPQGLSKLLRPHRIKTMPVKVEGKTVRGYKVEQFTEAFRRVLGVTGVTGVTSLYPSQSEVTLGNAGNTLDDSKCYPDLAPEAEGNAGNAGNTYHAPEQADEREAEPLSDLERARRFDALYPPPRRV
jgi:hypothetical protein